MSKTKQTTITTPSPRYTKMEIQTKCAKHSLQFSPDIFHNLKFLMFLLCLLFRHDHRSTTRVLLIDNALTLAQKGLGLLLRLDNGAAEAASGLDEVIYAGAFEVVLFTQLGGLHGLQEEGSADAGGEVEEDALDALDVVGGRKGRVKGRWVSK